MRLSGTLALVYFMLYTRGAGGGPGGAGGAPSGAPGAPLAYFYTNLP